LKELLEVNLKVLLKELPKLLQFNYRRSRIEGAPEAHSIETLVPNLLKTQTTGAPSLLQYGEWAL
jgi:hypothetical protein